METSENKPTPVVFKTFTSASAAPGAVESHKLNHFTIEYHKTSGGKNNSNYYLLTSHSDPSHPLRLYQSAINKLDRQLAFAFEKASKLEQQQQPLEDNEHYDCGIINSYGKMEVRLVLSTFHQQINIWLRLYMLDDDNQHLPTRTAVRFSPQDDLAAFKKFIAGKK